MFGLITLRDVRVRWHGLITIYLLLIHIYTGDHPATAVDVMGGPVIRKY